jgi:hypothetical protein
LLFIVIVVEKPASRRYDLEEVSNASITYFVMMEHSCRTDNQHEAIGVYVDERFNFSLLSFLISISSSSSVTADYEDSDTLNTYGSLT